MEVSFRHFEAGEPRGGAYLDQEGQRVPSSLLDDEVFARAEEIRDRKQKGEEHKRAEDENKVEDQEHHKRENRHQLRRIFVIFRDDYWQSTGLERLFEFIWGTW